MPYQWDDMTDGAPVHSGAFSFEAGDAPFTRLTIWPHQSLPRRGFAAFILITFGMLMLPLLAVLGSMVLWGLLPFLLGALGLTWYLLQRSYKDRAVTEILTLWSDQANLVRHNPRSPDQTWQANPHWVQVTLHPEAGRIENYLTLKGGPREVELGSFLTPEERATLFSELQDTLAKTRQRPTA